MARPLPDIDDTAPVTVTLLAIHPVNAGRLIAFADVEITISGISFELCGIKVQTDLLNGKPATRVSSPVYRDQRGNWSAALAMPRELHDPISQIVLDTCLEMGLCKRTGE